MKPREVYYDIQINNFESSGNTSLPLVFNETRSNPIISNSGDYSLSIVRFQLDTYSLPTFIASIEPAPNTDIHKMIETITLEYDNNGVKTEIPAQHLIWKPTNLHLPQPSAPSPLQEAQTEYYYGNSFRHYIDLINNTLIEATDLLKTEVGVSLNDVEPPFMVWNEQSQTAELYAMNEYFDENSDVKINIYFNRPLYGKFTSMPATKNFGTPNGKIYRIYMNNDNMTHIVNLNRDGLGDIKYIKTSQEYSTISNWCPTSSIVFTTSTLPIVPTQLSEPKVYSNGNAVSVNIPQNFAQVISDMATNDLCYKPNLIYVPSGENRYIDMIGNNDIKNINVSVFWKDVRGNLNPFYLQSGASASIKFLFKLKE